MSQNVFGETLRLIRSEGAFEGWSRRPKSERLTEDSSAFRASMCLRDAMNTLFEMDKTVSAGVEEASVLPKLITALRHLSSAMASIGEEEATGALEEVADYLNEVQFGYGDE